MKYNRKTKELLTDNNQVLKKIHCPAEIVNLNERYSVGTHKLHNCSECNHSVIDINGMTDKEVINIFRNGENQCVTFNITEDNFNIESDVVRLDNDYYSLIKTNKDNLINISTARNVEEINQAIKDGYKVIVKEIIENERVGQPYCLLKLKDGTYKEFSNPRDYFIVEGSVEIISKNYKDLSSRIHYAAYIVPKKLKKGTKVFLEDVIENIPHYCHYGCSRLEKCEAIYNGKGFDIQFTEKEIVYLIG